jgi:hypothetical protein
MQSLPKHIQFQLAFNAQVIGLCHDNELFGNAIITNTKLIHIPSHPKMLIIAVNPSRRSISNNTLGSPPSNVAPVERINTNLGE